MNTTESYKELHTPALKAIKPTTLQSVLKAFNDIIDKAKIDLYANHSLHQYVDLRFRHVAIEQLKRTFNTTPMYVATVMRVLTNDYNGACIYCNLAFIHSKNPGTNLENINIVNAMMKERLVGLVKAVYGDE